jgi:hypothetical protein
VKSPVPRLIQGRESRVARRDLVPAIMQLTRDLGLIAESKGTIVRKLIK